MTPRERQALAYIQAYQAMTGGVSPSFREIGAAIGHAGMLVVTHTLLRLEDHRAIRRLHDRTRAIEVVQPLPVQSRTFRFDGAAWVLVGVEIDNRWWTSAAKGEA